MYPAGGLLKNSNPLFPFDQIVVPRVPIVIVQPFNVCVLFALDIRVVCVGLTGVVKPVNVVKLGLVNVIDAEGVSKLAVPLTSNTLVVFALFNEIFVNLLFAVAVCAVFSVI